MQLEILPNGVVSAGQELTLRAMVRDAPGQPAALEPYLGMPAHAVVLRPDGSVYVHLHTMGTVTQAARDAFAARDRGDTTADGRVVIPSAARDLQFHEAHAHDSAIEFPYAFPRAGDYRLFVQVKRNGRVLTGAFEVPVVDQRR